MEISVMKASPLLLLLLLSCRAAALDVELGVEAGTSCTDIQALSESSSSDLGRYKTRAFNSDVPDYLVYELAVEGKKALVAFSCGGPRWSQNTKINAATLTQARNELEAVSAGLSEKYGSYEPQQLYGRMRLAWLYLFHRENFIRISSSRHWRQGEVSLLLQLEECGQATLAIGGWQQGSYCLELSKF